MSLSKFKLLQPTIIKFTQTYDIPKALRNQYVINFNAIGIDWFSDNFITLETGKGFLLQESPDHVVPIRLMLENFNGDKFDIPRVYIIIKEEYIDDDAVIFDFIQSCIGSNGVYGTGLPKRMIPGIDYYVNETLYNYLISNTDNQGNEIHPYIPVTSDIVVPNYLNSDGEIDLNYYDELSDAETDYINLKYYLKKNKSLAYSYSENQIGNICATFAQTILDLSTISDEDLLDPKNQAYKACLEYFANGGTDCATRMLELILGQSFAVPNTASSSLGTLGACGSCNSSSTPNDVTGQSCLDLYKQAMEELFKTMLSDPDFYNDWMNNDMGDECAPNGCLIDNIKDLLDAYEEANNDTSSNINKAKNCGCPKPNKKSNDDEFKDFDNFGNLLDYVCEDSLDQNKNKARLYGEEFANSLLSRCKQ